MCSKKFLLAMCFVGLTLVHFAHAQNSHQDYVNAHNVVRAEVGVGPMTWNNTVAAYAQQYANKRIVDCTLEHSDGPYGENLAEGSWNMNGIEAVKMWASEKSDYDHANNRCFSGSEDCLHYTQVVWRDSVHLGCARAQCLNGWTFVICSYYPVGNIVGQSPY